MKKVRIISAFLVVFLAFQVISVGAASGTAVFSIETPSAPVKAGETFEVAVKLSGNPGFNALDFILSFDNRAMKCEYIELGDILNGSMSATNPEAREGAIVSAAILKTIKGDGALALFEFTAVQDIAKFDFKLKNINFVDSELNSLAFIVSGDDNVEKPIVTPYEPPVDNNIETDDKEEPVTTYNFPDVSGHWAEPFVKKAVEYGLFKGDDNGNFNPNDNVTRAQFVTVLWRMAGKPESSVNLPFTDVGTQSDEFKKAIAWGYENGHINGTTDTTFEPNETLTREAGMKILHSYAGKQIGTELMFYAIYDGTFTDSPEISAWAKSSIYWGIYNKLISGTSNTTLDPKGTATRAQLAKILVNYLDIN